MYAYKAGVWNQMHMQLFIFLFKAEIVIFQINLLKLS